MKTGTSPQSAFITDLIPCLHLLLKEGHAGPQLHLCGFHAAWSLSRPCLLEICLLSVSVWTLLVECQGFPVVKPVWTGMNTLWVTDCVRCGVYANSARLHGVAIKTWWHKRVKQVFRAKEKLSKATKHWKWVAWRDYWIPFICWRKWHKNSRYVCSSGVS